MADEAEVIRRLIAETEALPKAELPSFMEWAAGHPSIINYRTKSPQRYDQDARRAHFMDKVLAEYPGAYRSERFPEPMREALYAHHKDPNRLKSAYEPYTEDHPLVNAATWMASLPAAVAATSQMAANAVDPVARPYPKAEDNYARAVNTFTGGLTEDLGLLPKNQNAMRSAMDMRDKRDSLPWKTLDTRVPDAMIDSAFASDRRLTDSVQSLRGAGVPESVAEPWGRVMDATLDPLVSLSAASKLSRAGKNWDASKQLLGDYGIGTAGYTVPMAIQGASNAYDTANWIRDFLNPPTGVARGQD
jgi:hypothetical protein